MIRILTDEKKDRKMTVISPERADLRIKCGHCIGVFLDTSKRRLKLALCMMFLMEDFIPKCNIMFLHYPIERGSPRTPCRPALCQKNHGAIQYPQPCRKPSSRPSPVKRDASRDPDAFGFIDIFRIPDLTALVRNDASGVATVSHSYP